jgi:hypothetical protein
MSTAHGVISQNKLREEIPLDEDEWKTVTDATKLDLAPSILNGDSLRKAFSQFWGKSQGGGAKGRRRGRSAKGSNFTILRRCATYEVRRQGSARARVLDTTSGTRSPAGNGHGPRQRPAPDLRRRPPGPWRPRAEHTCRRSHRGTQPRGHRRVAQDQWRNGLQGHKPLHRQLPRKGRVQGSRGGTTASATGYTARPSEQASSPTANTPLP